MNTRITGRAGILPILAVIHLCAGVGPANAADYTWGGADSTWSDTSATGWNGGPPAPGDTAVIDTGTVTATANDQPAGVHLTVGPGGVLNDGGYYLYFSGGTLALNSGTVQFSLQGDDTYGSGGLCAIVTARGGTSILANSGADKPLCLEEIETTFGGAGELTVAPGMKDHWNGASRLTKTGVGKLTLTGFSLYTGGTTVNEGTLELQANGGWGNLRGSLAVNAGGAVVCTGDGTGFGWQDGGMLDALAIAGGRVTSPGPMHVWRMSGGVTMTGGELSSNGGTNDPAGGFLEWSGTSLTTLACPSNAVIAGRIRLRSEYSDGITCEVADGSAAADLLITAPITPAPWGTDTGLTKQGPGAMALTGESSYRGATTVHGGALRIAGTGKIYAGLGWTVDPLVSVYTGGELEIDRWNGDGSLGQSLYSGANLVLDGGMLRYTGSETATPVLIDNNNGRAFSLGPAGGTLASDAAAGYVFAISQYWADWGAGYAEQYTLPPFDSALTLGGAGDGYIGKAISGSCSLTKTGSGAWTLAGVNSYTGPTTVSNGTLLVHGHVDTSSLVAILNGGALGGTGSVGHVTWHGGGAIAAGETNLNLIGQMILVSNASPFVVRLPVGFDPALARTWHLVNATDGITGFDANRFTVVGAGGGTAVVSTGGDNDLFVSYTPAVTLTLRLGGIAVSNGTSLVTVGSTSATDVVLEATSNLLAPAWLPVATQAVSGTAVLVDPAGTDPIRIYRARVD